MFCKVAAFPAEAKYCNNMLLEYGVCGREEKLRLFFRIDKKFSSNHRNFRYVLEKNNFQFILVMDGW